MALSTPASCTPRAQVTSPPRALRRKPQPQSSPSCLLPPIPCKMFSPAGDSRSSRTFALLNEGQKLPSANSLIISTNNSNQRTVSYHDRTQTPYCRKLEDECRQCRRARVGQHRGQGTRCKPAGGYRDCASLHTTLTGRRKGGCQRGGSRSAKHAREGIGRVHR